MAAVAGEDGEQPLAFVPFTPRGVDPGAPSLSRFEYQIGRVAIVLAAQLGVPATAKVRS